MYNIVHHAYTYTEWHKIKWNIILCQCSPKDSFWHFTLHITEIMSTEGKEAIFWFFKKYYISFVTSFKMAHYLRKQYCRTSRTGLICILKLESQQWVKYDVEQIIDVLIVLGTDQSGFHWSRYQTVSEAISFNHCGVLH